MSHPLEDYALIGDGETAALVSRHGSIDWLCWPRFDNDACFAALLGTAEHGCWQLAPKAGVRKSSRRYQLDTLIVETDLQTEEGLVRLIDFMPERHGISSVVRIVAGLEGRVAMRCDLRLRFDYGSLPPWCEAIEEGAVARIGPHLIVLRSAVPIRVHSECQSAEFTVTAGERVAFVLRYGPATQPVPGSIDAEEALAKTQQYWREWIGRFDDAKTRWPAAVRRSLVTLRAMVYRPSGGLVAAPTTSIPEAPGGEMNWDYRYCWLRDATFTVAALLNAGFHEEARAWRDWLLRAIAGTPGRMRIMYRVDGSRHLSEWEVDTLPGYDYARPVRVGNAASTQQQIDVFGEVLDCLSLARQGGLAVSEQEKIAQLKIVEHLASIWNTSGSGIWESRGQPRQYTYSKTMAWVGVDRVLKFLQAQKGAGVDSAHLARLTALRREIHDQICREGWNAGLGTFTQYYGGQEIDASLLLMPLVGFLPANDPRMLSTVEIIRRELTEDGLVRRKKAEPGKNAEGAFLACSCWMADCLSLQGRHAEAREQFEQVLARCNDVGLLSEEYNVPNKRLAGNFPQALTHLAVVNTALRLSGPVLSRDSP
ncbi:MAG TPA: glycoside hydrolase family 15 protein [Steroidobacteraceae bacterium]|nr:glycoside hydrolase family 15 protein [Steroidobacteraceae bacterium]